jgi:D-beta-D-heptose 7-phosphate kinase/D-beta-D-heptose 1-phosphate adenosyltransferase
MINISMKNIVLVTGGFDPIHSGHVAYIKEARKLGDILIVGANSDQWLRRKKKQEFMPWHERAAILEALSDVDRVINFDDSDGSAIDAIRKVKQIYPNDKIVFANGGDRTKTNIPEMSANIENVEFVFGVGGEHKMNSSSWILQEWKAPKTERPWGYYRVLHENSNEVKLKELIVQPGQKLSMQKHQQRAEHWFVAEGIATVYTINVSTDIELLGTYNKFQHIHINKTQWHQLCNESDQPLKMIEIQYGENCIEEDIERL